MDNEKIGSYGAQGPLGRAAQLAELAPAYVFFASQDRATSPPRSWESRRFPGDLRGTLSGRYRAVSTNSSITVSHGHGDGARRLLKDEHGSSVPGTVLVT
jgi:hypothetical protein